MRFEGCRGADRSRRWPEVMFVASGSVALLADLIDNFGAA
jgi:hypothetical protein